MRCNSTDCSEIIPEIGSTPFALSWRTEPQRQRLRGATEVYAHPFRLFIPLDLGNVDIPTRRDAARPAGGVSVVPRYFKSCRSLVIAPVFRRPEAKHRAKCRRRQTRPSCLELSRSRENRGHGSATVKRPNDRASTERAVSRLLHSDHLAIIR